MTHPYPPNNSGEESGQEAPPQPYQTPYTEQSWQDNTSAAENPYANQAQYEVGQPSFGQPAQSFPEPGQYAQYPSQQQYAYIPVAAPTDGFSVAALVLGLLGFNVVAIIFGIIGLNRTSTGRYTGRGMAIAGIVLGSLSLVVIVVLLIFMFAVMGAAVGSGAII